MTPPTIDLTGLRLRGLRPEDAVAWHGYLSDQRVIELTSYPEMSLPAVEAMIERCRKGYATGDSCTWAVATATEDELIGTCGFNTISRFQGWAELAYDLATPYWGRGFITQAVGACLSWAFEQPEINRVHAFVMVGNARSERVLERARFTREGRLRQYRMCRGQPRDYCVFSLLRSEWAPTDSRGEVRVVTRGATQAKGAVTRSRPSRSSSGAQAEAFAAQLASVAS